MRFSLPKYVHKIRPFSFKAATKRKFWGDKAYSPATLRDNVAFSPIGEKKGIGDLVETVVRVEDALEEMTEMRKAVSEATMDELKNLGMKTVAGKEIPDLEGQCLHLLTNGG